jgi:predicted nucleotidyltransferase
MLTDREQLDATARKIAEAARAEQAKAQAQQPVATVQVVMTADGNVAATCKVPNRQVLIMMLEVAKLDLHEKLVQREREKAAAGPQIETPNAGGILIAGG